MGGSGANSSWYWARGGIQSGQIASLLRGRHIETTTIHTHGQSIIIQAHPNPCLLTVGSPSTWNKPRQTQREYLHCWDLVFGNHSSAYMCSQMPKAACPLFWRKPEPPELCLPGCLNGTQRCEKRMGTQVSTNIGHSGPHDLCHQANIRPGLPLFCLFQHHPREEKGVQHLSAPLERRRVSRLFSTHLSTKPSMEERCSLQLISTRKPPPNSSSTNLQAATQGPVWQRTATFFPFHGRVTQLGSIIILG